MKESPELEALVRRLFKAAYIDHDVATVRNITQGPSDPSSGLRMILAADDEWFFEPDVEYIVQRTREIATTGVEFDHIEAFEQGDVGWFAASAILTRVDHEPSASRYTGIFVMEDGVWRSVQWHASLGVPNAEAWGVEISKDLEDLVESLDESEGSAIAASSNTGTVTLMFSDVEGSTQISESIGDAEWASLISNHMAGLGTSVQNHRGTLIKTLGDGAMAAFASVADALSCALELQDQATELPFSIRIGLHTGDAIHADGDYIGITVNKAARITSAAEPGEIMLSSVTAEMATGRGFGLGSSRSVELKGLAGTHRLTQLIGKPDRSARP
jgi:class 3 adenylate cyclase